MSLSREETDAMVSGGFLQSSRRVRGQGVCLLPGAGVHASTAMGTMLQLASHGYFRCLFRGKQMLFSGRVWVHNAQ